MVPVDADHDLPYAAVVRPADRNECHRAVRARRDAQGDGSEPQPGEPAAPPRRDHHELRPAAYIVEHLFWDTCELPPHHIETRVQVRHLRNRLLHEPHSRRLAHVCLRRTAEHGTVAGHHHHHTQRVPTRHSLARRPVQSCQTRVRPVGPSHHIARHCVPPPASRISPVVSAPRVLPSHTRRSRPVGPTG
ncbi:hypothetical protein SCOCK_50258 [Actinacidiphila cocklensis]|uniref:Uncharacterized protein n=1 Tax=Actinacidiphila cocklensis TaxID=887465 RepID=A0A9W4GU58_9ACTN|nr:hypothetical protein SCOCK_50258 [Actinacidiphila cocklensis]